MARKLIVEIVGDTSNLEKSFRRSSASANRFSRDISKSTRGVVAGTGAFQSLGRSLAFASGGFLAGASAGKLLSDSIDQATEQIAVEKKLAAQFKASRQELATYRQQIESASNRLSALAGIEDDELTQAFTNAFRGTQDVTSALKIQAVATDVAKGRGIALSTATIALTKAYLGQATALKRLGIQVPANIEGMKALEFVGRRFAGQAAAGTTTQERFAVALAKTEETIGLALLPTLNKYLGQLNKWLSNTENQRKVQKTADTGAKALGITFQVIGKSVEIATSKWNPFVDVVIGVTEAVKALNKEMREFERVKNLVPGVTGPVGTPTPKTTGANPPGVTGPAGSDPGPLGLRARFAKLELALQRALLTKTQADERKILVEEAANLRKQLASRKLKLKERTELTGQLVGIERQIASIDADATAAQRDANEKRRAAAQKILDARKEAADREKAQHQKELAAIRAREATLKTQIQAIQDRFKNQIDIARQGIGDLFGGPVLSPSDDATRRILGVQAAGADAGRLVADLRGQVAQFKAFQRDIATLIRRGAPDELIRELRAQGLGAATEVHALATAGAGTLGQFFKAFGQKEQLAIKTAKTVMSSQLVTLRADQVRLGELKGMTVTIHNTIPLDGHEIARNTTKHQVRAQKRTAAQRTGRIAGLGPVVG